MTMRIHSYTADYHHGFLIRHFRGQRPLGRKQEKPNAKGVRMKIYFSEDLVQP